MVKIEVLWKPYINALLIIYGDFGILLKLIIDGKSVIGVNLNEWALELLFILKGT